MATKGNIAAEINATISGGGTFQDILFHLANRNYKNDPITRKAEWGKTQSVAAWGNWQADLLSDAQEIEKIISFTTKE